MVKPCLYQKKKKIIRVWWYTPLVPATGEAEVSVLPELRKLKLQQVETVPLCSSLDDRAKLCLQKERKKKGIFGILILTKCLILS